jgi:hypothetical protein
VGTGVGNGVGTGVGTGVGNGVGTGVGNGVGTGVAVGVGNGVGVGVEPGPVTVKQLPFCATNELIAVIDVLQKPVTHPTRDGFIIDVAQIPELAT